MIIRYDLHDHVKIRNNCIGWFRTLGTFCTQSGTIVQVYYNNERDRYDHMFQCSCGGKHCMWAECDEIVLDEPEFYGDFEDKIKYRLL
jgi:hypothetical protein